MLSGQSPSGAPRILRVQTTQDFPSVAANAVGNATWNAVGSLLNDFLLLTPPPAGFGVAIAASAGLASPAGTGNISLINPTAGALDPASLQYDVRYIRDSLDRSPSGVLAVEKRQVTFDAANCPAAAVTLQTPPLGTLLPGDVVLLAPPTGGIGAGLQIAPGWVDGAGAAQVPFVNPTGGAVDPASLTYEAVILRSETPQSPSGDRVAIKGFVAAHDFGAQAGDSVTVNDVPIAEALPGDIVLVQQLTDLCPGIGWVEAAGTAKVPIANPAVAAVDPAAQNVQFLLLR